MGILTNENNAFPFLQNDLGPQIQQTFKSEHVQNGENPLINEISPGVVPIGHQGLFLLVDELDLVASIELHFLVTDFIHGGNEKL